MLVEGVRLETCSVKLKPRSSDIAHEARGFLILYNLRLLLPSFIEPVHNDCQDEAIQHDDVDEEKE